MEQTSHSPLQAGAMLQLSAEAAVAQGLYGCHGLGAWGQVQGCQGFMGCVKCEETV